MGDFDIVQKLNNLFPKAEFHMIGVDDNGKLRKHNFTGPNTDLANRLENYDRNTGEYDNVITEPINALDAAALEHDTAYHNKNLDARHEADKILMEKAVAIAADPDKPVIQRINATIVNLIIRSKLKLGWGMMNPNTTIGRERLKLITPSLRTIGKGLGPYMHSLDLVPRYDIMNYKGMGINLDPNTMVGKTNIRDTMIGTASIAAMIGIPALIKWLNDRKR